MNKNVATKASGGAPTIVPNVYCQRNACIVRLVKTIFKRNTQYCCMDIKLWHWKLRVR